MLRRFSDLADSAGLDLGVSGWRSIEQRRVDLFAEATGDHQWIHVDQERAASGPWGGTIAHGYLTLSLVPSLMAEVLEVPDRRVAINYGVEKIRFVQPVPVGARIRLHARVEHAEVRSDTRVLLRIGITIELEGHEKPAVVGEVLSLVEGPEKPTGERSPASEGAS